MTDGAQIALHNFHNDKYRLAFFLLAYLSNYNVWDYSAVDRLGQALDAACYNFLTINITSLRGSSCPCPKQSLSIEGKMENIMLKIEITYCAV
jgi:hypothetical protein